VNGNLSNGRCYLAGPMDRVSEEDAIGWRNYVTEELKSYNVTVYDPTKKPTDFAPEIGLKEHRQELIREKKYDQLSKLMKPIVRYDLRLVDRCDFVIVYIDTEVHLAGTYHEVVIALSQRKPVLAVIKQGKNNCPYWWFGCLKHETIFSSFQDLFKYLEEINTKDLSEDKLWKLFSY